MIRWRQFGRWLTLRRLAAAVLLFMLVGDLALHVGETYLEPPLPAGSDAAQFSAQAAQHSDESNCPIPGHSGSRFHHHHYPGIITSHGETAPSQLQRLVAGQLAETLHSASRIARNGRAPPLA